jgi:hypothetical protein
MLARRAFVALGLLVGCASSKTPKLVELPGDQPPSSDVETAFPPAPPSIYAAASDAAATLFLDAADAAGASGDADPDASPTQTSCGILTDGGSVLPSPLRATLRVPERVRSFNTHQVTVDGTVTLSNPGTTPLRWYERYVAVGLEMQDAYGRRVSPCPPPVPVPDDGVTGWNTLAPGASASFTSAADICHGVAPGRYRVRFVGVSGDIVNCDVKSSWMPVEIAPAN